MSEWCETEQEADERFSVFLSEIGASTCPNCQKTIDRGDVAWNNSATEAGTPCAWTEVQCQKCDTEITRFSSWIDADDFKAWVDFIMKDWPTPPTSEQE